MGKQQSVLVTRQNTATSLERCSLVLCIKFFFKSQTAVSIVLSETVGCAPDYSGDLKNTREV